MPIKTLKNADTGAVKLAEAGSDAYDDLTRDRQAGTYQSAGHEEPVASPWTDEGELGSGGGGSAFAHLTEHVFEVEDLLIPSGTDWSALGHALGSFTPDWGDLVLFKLLLEIDTNPGADHIILDVSDDPDYSVSGTEFSCEVTSTKFWNFASTLIPFGTTFAAAGTADLLKIVGPSTTAPLPDAPTLYAGIHTTAPTTGDLTIVRARAAFLVL